MQKKTTENLLEKGFLDAEPTGNASASSGKPQGLPDKFWDETKEEIRINEFIADYNNLARRDDNLVEGNVRRLPDSFDKYDITIPNPMLERDDELFKQFYEKGFTNEQAQFVYDLANERVIPVLDQLTVNFEAQKQLEKLINHFGGQEKFNEISRQISAWAKQNVTPEVYDALASTAEGVIALYKMMSGNEPMLARGGEAGEALSEERLRKMMEDPRYWRDKDSSYINKITQGFETLYPSK